MLQTGLWQDVWARLRKDSLGGWVCGWGSQVAGSRDGYGDGRKNKPTGLRIFLSIKRDIIVDQTASRGGFYGTDYSKVCLSTVGSS